MSVSRSGKYDMIYVDGPALFGCLVRFPEDYEAGRSYTLAVGLHGGGGNAEDFITLWDDFQDRDFVYAVPRAPYPMPGNGEILFDLALWPTGDEALISKATALTEEYVTNVVRDLTRRYKVGDVYLMGFSQGAIISYIVGIKYHTLFRGLICLSGPGLLAPLINPFAGSFDPDWLEEELIQEAKALRVFIAHGKQDESPNYELGVRSRDVLIRHGYDVTFRGFEWGHHLPPDEVLEQIVEWINT